MRILYHHRTRGRHVEGVHIRGIVHALRELGHEVTLMSFPGADPEHEPAAQAGSGRGRLAGAITRLPGVLFELLELGYNLVTLLRMGAAIRRLRPQLIYERYSLFLFASVWLARRWGIPLVLEINDSALVERVRPLRLRGLARRIEGWCLRNCTGLVFISTYFRAQAEAAYGTIAPSVISPNAADLTRFDPGRFDRARMHFVGTVDDDVHLFLEDLGVGKRIARRPIAGTVDRDAKAPHDVRIGVRPVAFGKPDRGEKVVAERVVGVGQRTHFPFCDRYRRVGNERCGDAPARHRVGFGRVGELDELDLP